MLSRRKVAVVGLLTAGALAAPFVAHSASGGETPVPPLTAKPVTSGVTLITGDVVRVRDLGGNRSVSVLPGKGREKVGFRTYGSGRNVSVIPADAMSLVQQGRLDQRLFNVSALIDMGYDDRRTSLPLIVMPEAGQHRQARLNGVSGASAHRDLPAAGAVAVSESRQDAVAFWRGITASTDGRAGLRTGLSSIWLDAVLQPSLDVSVPMIGAPAAWNAQLTGKGVKVAVIDSGIDTSHPDLAGRVSASKNFTSEPDLTDRVGHGTHVASTIAGSGAASNKRYRGVAPDVTLLNAKVCTEDGCTESAILNAMQWAADNGARIVNLSLGGTDSAGLDPLEKAVDDLSRTTGTLFVIAAGNEGERGEQTVGSPASADAALAVGAVTKTGDLAPFSSRGPRLGDSAVKPEITAPGAAIVAARSKDSGTEPAEGNAQYTSMNGTSMATPHVAGAAAILSQQHPTWNGATLKAALMAAAKPNAEIGVFEQGAGLVDIDRAIKQQATAEPSAITFAHVTDPQGRDITYRNLGSADQTLTLALKLTAADGKPVPADLVSVGAQQVTVPAGGAATVAVTAKRWVGGRDVVVNGVLTASGAGVRVTTPIAVDAERFTLTLPFTDRSGQAPVAAGQIAGALIYDMDSGRIVPALARQGVATVDLRNGRYVVDGFLVRLDPKDPSRVLEWVQLTAPSVSLSNDRTITMDARTAEPISIRPPDRTAQLNHAEFGWTRRVEPPQIWGSNDPFSSLFNVAFGVVYTAQVGGDAQTPGFVSYVRGTWGRGSLGAPVVDSPFVYHLYFPTKGRMFTGLTRTVRAKDVATVKADLQAVKPDVGIREAFPRTPGNSPVYLSLANGHPDYPVGHQYRVPRTVTEYYNDQGQWSTWYAPSSSLFMSDWTRYRPGKTYREAWGGGVIGPVFPEPDFAQQFATRYWNNVLAVPGPLFGDGAGHLGIRLGGSQVAVTTLYRNGKRFGSSSDEAYTFEVPPAKAKYRVVTTVSSGAPHILSTRFTGEWTFTSARVPDGRLVKLPMSAIRFTPKLNNGKAPAGKTLTLPITIERQKGAVAGTTRSLKLEVSFNDGRSWKVVTVKRRGEKGTAGFARPSRSGFVSLRASATDTGGNTVKQTIIRAYRF